MRTCEHRWYPRVSRHEDELPDGPCAVRLPIDDDDGGTAGRESTSEQAVPYDTPHTHACERVSTDGIRAYLGMAGVGTYHRSAVHRVPSVRARLSSRRAFQVRDECT